MEKFNVNDEYKNQLRKLQLTELEILMEVKRICEKHKLSYYLIGGTLIGAIRHRGFIPWDDDIDIAMPRDDYERFIEISKHDLDKKYFLQTPESDIYTPTYFMKIRKNNTLAIEQLTANVDCHKGIFIDIFPLDKIYHNKPIKNLLIFTAIRVMDSARSGKIEKRSLNGSLKQLVIYPLRFLPLNFMNKWIYILATKNRKKSIDYVTIYYYKGGFGQTMSMSQIYGQGAVAEFEGELFKIPANFNAYLSKEYGDDYMEIPPVEKRKIHSFIKLKF